MVIIPVYVSKMLSRKDRTWSIVIETNELTPDKIAQIAQMQGQYGVMAFKESELQHNERTMLDSVDTSIKGGVSPSQRMRNLMYKLYIQDPEGFSKFQSYYEHKMERISKHLMSLLDD